MTPSFLALLALLALAASVTTCHRGEQANPNVALRWELHDDGGIGLISSVVRCGPLAYLADFQQKIRPLDLALRRSLPAMNLEGPPLALAADCERRRLFVVYPPSRGNMEVHEIHAESGTVVRRHVLPPTNVQGAYFIPPSSLVVAGLVQPKQSVALRQTTPQSPFVGAHLAVRLDLDSSASEPILPSYDDSCIGAGACWLVSVAPDARGWWAAQPTSMAIAHYDNRGNPPRLISVASPGLLRTGRSIPFGTMADEGVRWRGENSTLHVFRTAERVVVVHARPRVGPDWQLGQQLAFTVLMNSYTPDGRLVQADVPLPDLAVGGDADGVWAIDYGPAGRTNGVTALALVKASVP